MDDDLIQVVWQRAGGRCEYCQLLQAYSTILFEIDHIIALKHRGPTRASNLALSCFYCNSYKGSNISGRDPRTRKLTPLFNPRRHKWARHFRWNGPILVGRTAIGRVTIQVLEINEPEAVATRASLIAASLFPPPGT
jgi:hypothetical protein